MLALLGAMEEEVAGLRKRLAIKEEIREQSGIVYHGDYRGKDILLVRTGIGGTRAGAAARLVLERFPVTALVSFGFAGGIAGGLRCGDTVIATTLHTAGKPDSPQRPAFHSSAEMVAVALQAAEKTGVKLRQGKCLTVNRVVCTPQEKQKLGADFRTDIVEMESYWIARTAIEKQVPFLAVRTLSDTVNDYLPPFDRMVTGEGRLLLGGALLYFAAHPWELFTLLRFQRHARLAGRRLDSFLDAFITTWNGR